MKKELEPVLEKLGITQEYVLEGIKSTIEEAEKDDTKLKALFKLSDILDLEDKSSAKVQGSSRVFRSTGKPSGSFVSSSHVPRSTM